MADKLRKNLVFLAKNITNLAEILVYLMQEDIISQDESDEVMAEKTPQQRNVKLINTMQKKDKGSQFLQILRRTNNKSCADRIEGLSSSRSKRKLKHPKISKGNCWWPERKTLIDSLHRRKYQNIDQSLVEELHDRFSKTENKRRIVICESADASKYSGMGGIGKTLTAKWYANEYEKEYDHILWIDCGEGSLLESFRSLAMDLEVKNQDKLNLKQMATKSFDELTEFKCLWVYDNAENYKGKDGIINVLPKEKENFFCIITSRSRQWGTKNIGFGKISALELDIFSDEETLAFLKSTLDDSIEHTDSQLKELGRLMGNLPLALQLAVAALIDGKIDLQIYIDKTSSEDLGNIVDEEFDDYEKTINKNVKILLDIILQQENGKLAYDTLMIFGYIRPDDVQSAFLMKVLNTDETLLSKAINLLEKYNLVTKTTLRNDNDDEALETYFLSIHRLLQQVIRHNGRETEEETLRKILGCEGFIDYKLLPFTKYADAKLQKEFPKIKAELLDQEQLTKLIGEKRFEESVQLAKFISEELKTNTSRFNFAICLDKNEQLEDSVDVLEKLEKQEMKVEREYDNDAAQMGILRLKEEMSKDLIDGHLLALYWRLDNKKRIRELLEKRNQFQIIHSDEFLDILIRILHSDLIQLNYSLVKGIMDSTITFKLRTKSKKIELGLCPLDLSSFSRLSPTELTLVWVSFTREGHKLEEVTANEFIDLDKVNRLELWSDYTDTKICIDLSGDISLEYLCLRYMTLLGWKKSKWNIQRLELHWIPFVEKTKMTIKEMVTRESCLDISCLPRTTENLHLDITEVFCSEEIELPNLNYLTLTGMTDCCFLYSVRSVNLTHIYFDGIEELDVDLLPKSVTHIKITGFDLVPIVVGVRRVDKLILEYFSFLNVEELLSQLKTDDLVVQYLDLHISDGITPAELIELTKKEIKRIAVGEVNWGEEDFSILFSHVDRKAAFYLWEGGRGRGIEKEEFEELNKLY